MYTDVAKVSSEFKSIEFSQNTAITEAEVEAFISQADQYIDSRIGIRYQVPVTEGLSPKSFVLLSQISTFLVAQRIKEILEVKNASDDVEQDTRPGDLRRVAMSMIKQIIEGTLLLPDATVLRPGGAANSFNVKVNREYIFDIDKDQW